MMSNVPKLYRTLKVKHCNVETVDENKRGEKHLKKGFKRFESIGYGLSVDARLNYMDCIVNQMNSGLRT